MKRYLIAPVLALTLLVGGCATGSKLDNLIQAVTTTITNPVGATDIYRVKNAYAAALQLVVGYREYCWSRPYAVLMADPISKPICERRRAVVRAAQSARRNARGAINAAEQFVANNPTLNAASAVSAAWQAVTDFQNSVPRPQ